MNINALRQHAITQSREDAFTGTWRVVQWQPDLFGPQRFVVGVLVESASGQRAYQIMDKPERIECFFKPRLIRREFASLMSLLRNSLAEPKNGAVLLPSPNFSFNEARFVRGASAQEIASRLFAETVTAASPLAHDEEKGIGPNTEETRKQVTVFLKQMCDLSFERIFREQGQTLSDHYLDVTLAPDNGAGSVISACYRSLTSIELKLLRAASDINAYASAQRCEHKAIFILEPSDDAPISPKERKAMDSLIGNELWKLEQAGFDTPRNTDFGGLARDIHDWAIPLLSS